MAGSKESMPAELKSKCHKVIHTATATAGAAGAIPIPVADTVPITSAQIAMIIALGKVFDLSLSESVAKSIALAAAVPVAGRTIASSIIKIVPGVGSIVGAATAAALTEAVGWMVADDFYRISIGRDPIALIENANDLRNASKDWK